jgi:hypothetical protein
MSAAIRARRTWLAVAAVAALAFAALMGLNPLEPPTDDGATKTGGAATFGEGGLATFDNGALAFDYPASWRVFHYDVVSSFTSVLAYLGTVEVADPCRRTANTVSCGSAFHLEPGTLVVTITAASFPGRTALSGAGPDAVRVEVGGLPGLRLAGQAFPGVDADASVEWRFARPGLMDNWYEIRADLRGPGEAGLLLAVERMVDSVRFDPPVTPLDASPAGRAAALDELGAFLDAQAADDATWDCFPRLPGARDAVISREPYGPELAVPLAVRCSTAIRSNEFQVWEVTLRIDWGLTPGDRIGHWQATLFGGRGQGWNVYTQSDAFPGSASGDRSGG